MKLLLDTHLLLWSAKFVGSGQIVPRLSPTALGMIGDSANDPMFSAASIWEIAIKSSRDRSDFDVDAHAFRRVLLENGYGEITITSRHAAAVSSLPAIHKDPFDRLLVAQAGVEGITLLTSHKIVATYPGPIRLV